MHLQWERKRAQRQNSRWKCKVKGIHETKAKVVLSTINKRCQKERPALINATKSRDGSKFFQWIDEWIGQRELQTITIINISEDPIHKGADNSEDNDEILLTGTENKRRASRKKNLKDLLKILNVELSKQKKLMNI